MGATPQPDPCARGCIFFSFMETGEFYNLNAMDWWNFWLHVSREHKDPETKKVEHAIDYQSLDTAYSIFGIEGPENKQEVLSVMTDIASYHTAMGVTRDQMLGTESM